MGRKIVPEVSISLPFQIDSYGKVGSTVEQPKIWADRVRSVIGTSLRERTMRPNFGTVIPFALFDTSETATSEIEAEVKSAFLKFLPTLSLQEVTAEFDDVSNIINVSIIYALPNDQIVTTTIGIMTLRGTTPPVEELL
jgi:phage baseplate assembly protein W